MRGRADFGIYVSLRLSDTSYLTLRARTSRPLQARVQLSWIIHVFALCAQGGRNVRAPSKRKPLIPEIDPLPPIYNDCDFQIIGCRIRPYMLTPRRVKIYCLTIILTNLTLFSFSIARSSGYSYGADFEEFYNAGSIFIQTPSRLYDLELQDQLFESHGGQGSLPYAYAPWFVLPFAVLTALPFKLAFTIWTIGSITLMSGAYFLCWREGFPLEWRWPGLFAALAFPPFQFFALRGGQVSAF